MRLQHGDTLPQLGNTEARQLLASLMPRMLAAQASRRVVRARRSCTGSTTRSA